VFCVRGWSTFWGGPSQAISRTARNRNGRRILRGLFSALAAAYFENGSSTREKEALEWLERQKPTVRSCRVGGCIGDLRRHSCRRNYPGDGPARRAWQAGPRTFRPQGPSEATALFHSAGGEPRARDRGSASIGWRAGQLTLARHVPLWACGQRMRRRSRKLLRRDAAGRPGATRAEAGDGSENWPGWYAADQRVSPGRRHGTGGWDQPGAETRADGLGVRAKWRSFRKTAGTGFAHRRPL